MRVTSKGRVTIPIAPRARPGIGPETEVELGIVGDEERLRDVVATAGRGRELVAAMREKATSGLTTNEVMRVTRSEP